MQKELNIIYIEDNPDDVRLAEYTLKKGGFSFKMRVMMAEDEFVQALNEEVPDLVLCDHSLPRFNSMAAFKISRNKVPDVPFILLTGSVSEEFAVDCLLAGIDDYILKSNLIRLPSSIERILAKKKMKQEKEIIEMLHKELRDTYKVIETKNKEIIDSINYAKRIQDAILPHDNQFAESFHDGFVIYEPRDIVSGDFYWLAKTTAVVRNNFSQRVLAAIDCTGHGIPGAFMSMLVSAFLNQTLKNKKINSPANVLEYLNRKLPHSLNKNNKERINDGLDLALCALDLDSKVIYFAGANRPLWVLRKNSGNFELLEFKGTKASISAYTPENQVFENYRVQLEKGDRFFIFTDGITDQFGGRDGKKMGRKKLKEVIVASAGLDMKEQRKYIYNFMTEWRGALEQIDDILLIGIEID